MHKLYSRIDDFLVSREMIEAVVDCKIVVITLLDHASGELSVVIKLSRTRVNRWRLNASLL